LTVFGLVLTVSVLWGLTYPALRIAMQHSPPYFFAMGRTAIGGALIILTAVLLSRPLPTRPRDLAILVLAGILNYGVFYAAMNLALRDLTAGEVAVLNYTMPLWMVVMARAAFGQRVRRLQALGLLLGFIGVIGVVGSDLRLSGAAAWQAYLVVLAGAFAWAAGSLLFLRSASGIALEWGVGLQSLFASIALVVPWLFVEGGELPDGSLEFWLPFGYVSLLAAFVAQLAFFSLLRRRGSTAVGAYVFLVPVVAAASGIALLNEPISGPKVVGALCVLAGITLVNRS
jgi:drug/metabolite transporter (DMT)-like permease